MAVQRGAPTDQKAKRGAPANEKREAVELQCCVFHNRLWRQRLRNYSHGVGKYFSFSVSRSEAGLRWDELEDRERRTDMPNHPDPRSPRGTVHDECDSLLSRTRTGDTEALNRLLNLVYPELKRRARWLMAGERPGHTFGVSGSELLQRTLEKMLQSGGAIFRELAAEEDLIRLLTRQMRFILVDYARARRAEKRPSSSSRVDFEEAARFAPGGGLDPDQLLAFEEALTQLCHQDKKACGAVELRYFSGLTNEEAASAMGLSVATFRRCLRQGTVFLRSALTASARRDDPR